jgi:hypothetical protein
MITPALPSYAGYRFPAEIISFAVWLYPAFRSVCAMSMRASPPVALTSAMRRYGSGR